MQGIEDFFIFRAIDCKDSCYSRYSRTLGTLEKASEGKSNRNVTAYGGGGPQPQPFE